MNTGRQFAAWNEETARELVQPFASVAGGLLPALHALQKSFGCVEDAAVPIIADIFNYSRAEVHGVISFYHDFRKTRPGRYTIKVCRAEACQAVNGQDLVTHLKERLGIDFHETDPSDLFSLEPVYCLGNCAAAPAIMVDEAVVGRVTPEKVDALLADLRDQGGAQ